MNNIVARTNVKGQFVLPISMRNALGITPETNLHVSLEDKVITITPLPAKPFQTKKSLYEILKSTQGAWARDNWPATEARQRKIEIAAAKKLRNAW
jgi:bifunctional DNA-binding transcriptional regulator/antitoxin component of YhaV-PrlF toxin-antitoxin module